MNTNQDLEEKMCEQRDMPVQDARANPGRPLSGSQSRAGEELNIFWPCNFFRLRNVTICLCKSKPRLTTYKLAARSRRGVAYIFAFHSLYIKIAYLSD